MGVTYRIPPGHGKFIFSFPKMFTIIFLFGFTVQRRVFWTNHSVEKKLCPTLVRKKKIAILLPPFKRSAYMKWLSCSKSQKDGRSAKSVNVV